MYKGDSSSAVSLINSNLVNHGLIPQNACEGEKIKERSVRDFDYGTISAEESRGILDLIRYKYYYILHGMDCIHIYRLTLH